MATDRNTSSVLAKLMGIDRILPPRKTHGRHRVLSENYLQHVSSVIHMEKSILDASISVFNMDDGDHVMCDETVESSEGASVDDHQSLVCENANSGLNTYCGDSRMMNKRNEVTFSPKTPSFEQCEGFDQRGPTRSYSLFGYLAVQSSSRTSEAEKHKSIESHLTQPRSCQKISTGRFSGSTNKRQKIVSGVRNKRLGLQERRKSSLRHNGMKSTVWENVSSKEIAKQITNQVNHSVWHNCIKVSKSEGRVDKSDADEYGGTLPSAEHLIDSDNKCEVSSSNPSKMSDIRNTLKTKKTLSESWRASKDFPKGRAYNRRKSQDQMHFLGTTRSNYTVNTEDVDSCALVSTNVYCCRVASARFLSGPTLFPSAWVPRSKERRFNLDRNWCSRPGDWDGILCNESSEDKVGDDIKPSVTTIDSAKVQEESTFDHTVSVSESLSDHIVFSDAESPTCHEACEILKGKGDNHLDNNISQDISLVAIHSTCDSSPPSVKTRATTVDEKMNMSSKLQGEQLPVKASKNNLFDDAAPSQNDIVLKHELKSTTSPPGSPVSSLEGPEACRHRLNFTVNSKETYVPQCLDAESLGLQTKLHLLEAVSTESGSEGPGMAVSSDVSDGGGSVGCYREDVQISQCTSESCDFSYLVDVLTESGLMMGNLETENEMWCAGSNVLDPSVFDFLEKKYGKSTVRERSERRLLFDRINSGLVEILRHFVGIHSWRKPVVKRLSVRQSWEFTEEDLWSLLVNQEEESKNGLSDKVCGREMEWLDFEEDVDFIVQEIQSLLIHEFVEEFLSMEMFCH